MTPAVFEKWIFVVWRTSMRPTAVILRNLWRILAEISRNLREILPSRIFGPIAGNHTLIYTTFPTSQIRRTSLTMTLSWHFSNYWQLRHSILWVGSCSRGECSQDCILVPIVHAGIECNFTKLDPFCAYFLGKTVRKHKIKAETVLIMPKSLGGD